MGAGTGSNESELGRRQRSDTHNLGHGKRPRLSPELAVGYNKHMGGVDANDHMRVIRTVDRRFQKPYFPLFFLGDGLNAY